MSGISAERVVVLVELEKPLHLVEQRRDFRTSLVDMSGIKDDPTFETVEEEKHVPDVCAARTTCGEPVEVCRSRRGCDLTIRRPVAHFTTGAIGRAMVAR